MKIRALRGVCIGVNRSIAAGEDADLDAATVQFLTSIGAVEIVKDLPAHEPLPEPSPAPGASTDPNAPDDSVPAPKSGKKEN